MEHTFYNQGGVSVTNTRFIVANQTYAMRNITSVKAVQYPPPRNGPTVLLLLGILTAFFAFIGSAYWIAALGIVITGLAIWWFTRQRPTFGVVLATSGGEVRALEHRDWPFIESIITALNQSIMSHG